MTEELKFVSERGSIAFSSSSKYVFTSIENLNGAETTRQENTYVDADGAEYSDIFYQPETVSVKGFIRAANRAELITLRAKLFQHMNGKDSGILYYSVSGKRYFTEAQTVKPIVGERMQNILSFTVYFERFNVLWKKDKLFKYDIYTRKNTLKTTFTLPCAFSTRTMEKTVINNGDVPAECVIKIKGLKYAQSESGKGISILNVATGEGIYLDCDADTDEIITIDTAKASVVSSKSGNIMNHLFSKSVFGKIICGKNAIKVTNENPSNDIIVTVEYYNTVLGV